MHKHMRRRLSPEGLDMRDGTPENRISELLARAGLPVPAPPFAQRAATISDANPLAKFCVNDAQRPAVAAASGDVIARL